MTPLKSPVISSLNCYSADQFEQRECGEHPGERIETRTGDPKKDGQRNQDTPDFVRISKLGWREKPCNREEN
jgi:hypothetical protein